MALLESKYTLESAWTACANREYDFALCEIEGGLVD